MRTSKLKPIDDKLTNSKIVDKQSFIQGSGSNVIILINSVVMDKWS